jgi:hypothetical protein
MTEKEIMRSVSVNISRGSESVYRSKEKVSTYCSQVNKKLLKTFYSISACLESEDLFFMIK